MLGQRHRRWSNIKLVLVQRFVIADLRRFKALYKSWRPKGGFQFEVIINVLVSAFHFTTYVMALRPLYFFSIIYNYFFSAEIVFRRQNLTSLDVQRRSHCASGPIYTVSNIFWINGHITTFNKIVFARCLVN